MGNLHDLLLLLVLGGIVTAWMKLSRAREIAVSAARRHCELHGLQLLDETVGLRAIRLRRMDGHRRLERGYGFDVSIDGEDREQGRLWMIGQRVSGLNLPTVQWLVGGGEESTSARRAGSEAPIETGASSNVIPLRRRLPNDQQRH
ncbi:DUF3301 domain-containing protein [Dyella ginsengisoli]|uniref:DUF3301 domain-containing protein n=1 Tax=Dyella ginsengisoli TaxID=363848 RepID=A0ABW8JQ66_9GAMM